MQSLKRVITRVKPNVLSTGTVVFSDLTDRFEPVEIIEEKGKALYRPPPLYLSLGSSKDSSSCFQDLDLRKKFKEKRIKRCGCICVKYIFGAAHVLVVRGKRSRIWSLPKGCINEGESEIDCAQRETLEETGLAVELQQDHQRICINHNVYFLVLVTSHLKLRTRDKEEVDKVNWMTIDELRTLECNKDLRSILQYPNRKFTFHTMLEDVLQLGCNLNESSKDDESTTGSLKSSEEDLEEIEASSQIFRPRISLIV